MELIVHSTSQSCRFDAVATFILMIGCKIVPESWVATQRILIEKPCYLNNGDITTTMPMLYGRCFLRTGLTTWSRSSFA